MLYFEVVCCYTIAFSVLLEWMLKHMDIFHRWLLMYQFQSFPHVSNYLALNQTYVNVPCLQLCIWNILFYCSFPSKLPRIWLHSPSLYHSLSHKLLYPLEQSTFGTSIIEISSFEFKNLRWSCCFCSCIFLSLYHHFFFHTWARCP